MDKQNFAFTKLNFILLAIGMGIVILGFVLMSGPGSNEAAFNPDIFSVRRIKVAPVVCLAGFLFIIAAIMYRPKRQDTPAVTATPADDTQTAPKK